MFWLHFLGLSWLRPPDSLKSYLERMAEVRVMELGVGYGVVGVVRVRVRVRVWGVVTQALFAATTELCYKLLCLHLSLR